MALQIDFSLSEAAGCRVINLWDTTGNYNVSTNPTGWGAPNATINSIDQILINVYPEGYTTPILLDIAVTTGTVTGIDITLPGGTATAFSLTGLNTTFPWTEALPLAISGEMLTDVEDSEITFGAYTIEYEVLASSVSQSVTNTDALVVCQVERAVKNAQGSLSVDCICDCNNGGYKSAYQSRLLLDSAKYAMGNSEPIKAAATLQYAYDVASGNCKTC